MTQSTNNPSAGFTLLELMITIAIIAVIAAIAIPSYINYTKKAHYSELVNATAAYKLGVAQCYNETGTFTGCNSGNTESHGIPPSITAPPNSNSAISKIVVVDGVITASPNPINGITSQQHYILSPTLSNGVISWTASGQGVADGLAK